jgi:hypothetical protein
MKLSIGTWSRWEALTSTTSIAVGSAQTLNGNLFLEAADGKGENRAVQALDPCNRFE